MKNVERISALDGLRGYASLIVVIFHSTELFLNQRPEGYKLNDLLVTSLWTVPSSDFFGRLFVAAFNGQTAVLIFFSISGAVLIRSIKTRSLREWATLPTSFLARRAVRIYPALIGCLLGYYTLMIGLNAIWPTHFPTFSLPQFLENASLYKISMHGATWTLQVEMIAVPFILIAYALKQWIGGVALVMLFCYSILVAENPILSFGSRSAYLWMPAFTAGMLAAHLASSKVIQEINAGWRWAVFLFALLFMNVITNPGSLTSSIIRYIATVFLIAHILDDRSSSFKRFLSAPFSRYLGKISYSLYLWNVPILVVFSSFLAGKNYGEYYLVLGPLSGCLIFFATVPIAHVSELYLERSYSNFKQWSAAKNSENMLSK